ncbi:Proline iminopeptidase [Microbacterium trichothecenolyticum]|uniref:Proline iminopeptidase n=1 Tax=Microbacterium trichothecenolyticum TaxID=69370 RepID=A0A0M2HGD6_MICTR|nr:Proline iminopeptidase [Microbacterium trichothecenolyticum]
MNEHLDDILYPPIEPYDTGTLIAGEGNRIAYEQSGNPEGKPVVFLHGGPGAGTSAWHRRFFDPERYRIILLDQRGCGRSTPHASEPDADLRHNTTWHLVADIELLRKNLGIERWQVFGGSWGSALALAYAEAHPQAVTEIVLRGIFTLRRHELEWFYEGGAASIVPDLWEDFIAPIPILERSQLMQAYHRRLSDPDPAVHVPAAVAWSRWEAANLTLLPDDELIEAMTEPRAAVAFARIENHYFLHGGWFEPEQLIANVGRIRDIPAVIVQGRYDVCTPAMTAWDLHRAWPEADFVMIPDAAHAASEPGIASALRAATDRFAEQTPAEKTQAPAEDAEAPAEDAEAPAEATEAPADEPGAAGIAAESEEVPESADPEGEPTEEESDTSESAMDEPDEPESEAESSAPEADLEADDPDDAPDPEAAPHAEPALRRERIRKGSKKRKDTAGL